MRDFQGSVHGQARAKGITDAPLCKDCHGDPHLIQSSDSADAKHNRANILAMCARCHADINISKKYDIPIADPVETYKHTVHGQAIAKGNYKAAVCSDCHGAHTILPGNEKGSKTSKQSIAGTCRKCHEKIFDDYIQSVHGKDVAKGSLDAPTCTGCHGEHSIVKIASPESPVNPLQLTTKSCGQCHSNVILAKKYGFETNRVSSYEQSYHGLASHRGSTTVANCSSCHGIHLILPSADPRSTIARENLSKTCGQCHPKASEQFANTPVHLNISPQNTPILHWVRYAYLWMIFGTIGLMLLHNFLIFLSAVVQKIRHVKRDGKYRRFTTIQLVMHGLLLASFWMLVLSGFGLKFPDVWWAKVFTWLHVSEVGRQWIHRVSACVMLGAGFMHMGYVLATRHGKMDFLAFFPRYTDVKEAFEYVRYYVLITFKPGARPQKPALGRYSYMHKAEYWALVWGTVVMTFTGLALWFPVLAAKYLPIWGLPLAELIHYYEAWLATLAIVVWHFFFVIFHPDEYPMSVIWLTGRVTEEEMEREHPRELEEIETS